MSLVRVALNRAKAATAALALSKTRSSIREYGAKGGSFDDVIVLQGAIDDKAKAGGGEIQFPDDTRFSIGSNVIIKAGVTLSGGTIRTLALAQVIMTGANTALRNMTIDATGYGSGTLGIIELVETVNARIENVTIKGNHLNKGIMCKTQATNTTIKDVTISGIGWGILFNDSSREQGDTYRTYNGKSYNDVGIGSGLDISGFVFTPGNNRQGDGIEINCPDYGFTQITVSRSRINGTIATSSNGIGIGFARCYYVTVSDCFVQNTAFDAYHFEKCSHFHIHHCHAFNCGRALGISHVQHGKADHNNFANCGTWMASYNNATDSSTGLPYQIMTDFLLEKNSFVGVKEGAAASSYGILVGYASNVRILDNTFKDYGGSTSSGIIQFYNTGAGNVTDSVIKDNLIDKGSSAVAPSLVINVTGDDALNNNIRDNTILGYASTAVSVDVTRNRLKYKVRRNVSGTSLYNVGGTVEMAGDPKGYAVARPGIRCVNTITGKEWIGTGKTNQDWAEYVPVASAT